MDIDDLDALYARLRDGERRVSVDLVDLDANPTYRLLSSGPLQGETARRAGAAVAAARDLWALYHTLRNALDEVATVRGADARPAAATTAEVERLLTTPRLAAVPDPTLPPGASQPAQVDVATVLDRLRRVHELVLAAVRDVEDVWARVVPRLDAARRALEPLRTRAAAIDLADEPALDSAGDLVARTEQRLGDDPLGLSAVELEALDAATALAAQRVTELERMHATVDDEARRGTELLAELAQKCNDVRAGYARVVEKVARPSGVADLGPGDLDAFRALRAEAATALAGDEQSGVHWRSRRVLLDAWIARAVALGTRLDALIEANAAPVRRRDELRGLLAALEAKAAGRDRIERPETVERLREAHAELSGAPCDVDRAASLLDELTRELSSKDT